MSALPWTSGPLFFRDSNGRLRHIALMSDADRQRALLAFERQLIAVAAANERLRPPAPPRTPALPAVPAGLSEEQRRAAEVAVRYPNLQAPPQLLHRILVALELL